MGESSATERILVVDDEPGSLTMLRLLLRAYGYTVFTADSGAKGLEVFRQEAPPIVLTDIRMPGLDGIEVLKRLKQMDPDVEVIVITGHGDMDLAIQCLQEEASDFINKPIQKAALEVALRRAQERIGLKKQLADYTHNLEKKVAEATAELAKSCRQLETLYEISQALGEKVTLDEILGLLKSKIQSMTGGDCHGLLILDSQKKAIAASSSGTRTIKPAEDLIGTIKELKEPRVLSGSEAKKFLALYPESETEKIIMLPILQEDEHVVGAALLGFALGQQEGDLRPISFLLARASGSIRRAVTQEEELQNLRQIVGLQQQFGDLIGRHEKMGEVYRLVSSIADSDATVLVLGESGTGKELIARRIHDLSSRRGKPFVVVNCAAYPETLLESELFGHERGAFTGAIHTRRGSFELAHGGTIFLDEIGEVPLAAQVKLLRVIQFREFQRIGSETTVKVDVRVLAATSKDLRREMEQGHFREDLYYRLHVIPIMMPPLRARISDLPLLAGHFLRRFSERSNKKILGIKPAVMDILLNYSWPGNVRELENVMEHAFILARRESIEVNDLPAYLQETLRPRQVRGECLEEVEREHLIRVLKQCHGNKIEAARRLKISRSTLYRKLEHYQLGECSTRTSSPPSK